VASGGRVCFLALGAAGVALVALTLRRLPQPMAVHFGAAGTPNGWAGHGFYLATLALIGLALPLGIVALVSRLSATHPDTLNVPGKDYWFHPARRAEGVRRVTDQMWWLACLMLALAVGVHVLLLAANAAVPPRLPTAPFLVLLAAFLIGLLWWIRSLTGAMRAPPRAGADS
jgi:uncharacterized membrane protein